MQRWQKIVGLMAVVAVLASVGASAQAARATAKADPVKVGIIYSRTGALAAYGAEYIQGLRYGLAYATKGTNAVNGQKIELTIVDDGTRPGQGRLGREGPDREGLQDHRRQRLVGRRPAARAARGPEPGPLHLGPGRVGRHHGDQQVHVPVGSPELPGRARSELVSSAAAAART